MDRPRARDRDRESEPKTGTQAQAAGPELQLKLGICSWVSVDHGLVGYGFWLVKVTFECVLYQMPIDRADRMLDDDDDDDDDRLLLCPRLCLCLCLLLHLLPCLSLSLSAIYGAPKSCAMAGDWQFCF